jgi:hypothetical protein
MSILIVFVEIGQNWKWGNNKVKALDKELEKQPCILCYCPQKTIICLSSYG